MGGGWCVCSVCVCGGCEWSVGVSVGAGVGGDAVWCGGRCGVVACG